MPTITYPFDPIRYLDTPEAQAIYLEEALTSGDPAVIGDALRVVARARGGASPPDEVSTGEEREVGLDTLLSTVGALGRKLRLTPA